MPTPAGPHAGPAVNARADARQRRLEPALLVAAVLTIPALVIEASDTGPALDTLAIVLDVVVWLAFALEFVTVLRIADDRRRWLRDHPLEVAILVLTPPFAPAGLQAARVFRLLRLLRLLKLAFIARRLLSTEGVRDAGVLAIVVVLGGGAAFAAVENGHHDGTVSAWDGLWWAMTTVTTVGYGDFYPVTTAGRIIAIAVMLAGIGFVAILTAAAAERFLRREDLAERDLDALHAKLDRLAERLDSIERPQAGSASSSVAQTEPRD